MPIANLATAGVLSSVARMIDMGRSDAQILASLRRTHSGETMGTYNAALNRGRQAYDAGANFDITPNAGRVLAADIPRVSNTFNAYRYTVDVQITDPGSGAQRYTTESVHSLTNLSPGELEALLQQRVTAYALPLAPGMPTTPPPAPWQFTGFHVVAIERTL